VKSVRLIIRPRTIARLLFLHCNIELRLFSLEEQIVAEQRAQEYGYGRYSICLNEKSERATEVSIVLLLLPTSMLLSRFEEPQKLKGQQ